MKSRVPHPRRLAAVAVAVAVAVGVLACQPLKKSPPFDPQVGFYQHIDDGTSFRSQAPRLNVPLAAGGTVSQVRNPDGSISLWISGAQTLAANGFVLIFGPLADLTATEVTASGSTGSIHLGLLFDVGGDGEFFRWDASGRVIDDAGDKAGATPNPTLTIGDDTVFNIEPGGEDRTLAQLKAGDEQGITATTKVAIAIGICCGFGSTSARIESVTVNGAERVRG